MKKWVTVSIEFDTEVPINAETDEDATDQAEQLSLSEIFDWSICASYNLNVLSVRDD